MASYFLALINIRDSREYDKYLEKFDEVFAAYDGTVLLVEDDPEIMEGQWPAGRTVLIRFPSSVELRRWYESAEYQRIALHRRRASEANIAILTERD